METMRITRDASYQCQLGKVGEKIEITSHHLNNLFDSIINSNVEMIEAYLKEIKTKDRNCYRGLMREMTSHFLGQHQDTQDISFTTEKWGGVRISIKKSEPLEHVTVCVDGDQFVMHDVSLSTLQAAVANLPDYLLDGEANMHQINASQRGVVFAESSLNNALVEPEQPISQKRVLETDQSPEILAHKRTKIDLEDTKSNRGNHPALSHEHTANAFSFNAAGLNVSSVLSSDDEVTSEDVMRFFDCLGTCVRNSNFEEIEKYLNSMKQRTREECCKWMLDMAHSLLTQPGMTTQKWGEASITVSDHKSGIWLRLNKEQRITLPGPDLSELMQTLLKIISKNDHWYDGKENAHRVEQIQQRIASDALGSANTLEALNLNPGLLTDAARLSLKQIILSETIEKGRASERLSNWICQNILDQLLDWHPDGAKDLVGKFKSYFALNPHLRIIHYLKRACVSEANHGDRYERDNILIKQHLFPTTTNQTNAPFIKATPNVSQTYLEKAQNNSTNNNLILLHTHTDVDFINAVIKSMDWIMGTFDTIYIESIAENLTDEKELIDAQLEIPLANTLNIDENSDNSLYDLLAIDEIEALGSSTKQKYSANPEKYNLILWNKLIGFEKYCAHNPKTDNPYDLRQLHALFFMKYSFFCQICRERGVQIKGVEPENYQARSASLKDRKRSLEERKQSMLERAQLENSKRQFELDFDRLKKDCSQYEKDDNKFMVDRDRSMAECLSKNHSGSRKTLFIVGSDHGKGLMENLSSSGKEKYRFVEIVLDKENGSIPRNHGYSFNQVTRKGINDLEQTLASFYEKSASGGK